MPTSEFIRRFLMHVLPDRFHRIRHYGFLAGAGRQDKVARIGALLGAPIIAEPAPNIDDPAPPLTLREPCPDCGGPMRIIDDLPTRTGPKVARTAKGTSRMMKRPSSAPAHDRHAKPPRSTEELGHLSAIGQVISSSTRDPQVIPEEMLPILAQTPMPKWQTMALSLRSNAAHDTLSP